MDKGMLISLICLALGVFFGNWLFVPFLGEFLGMENKRSFRDGFWIGLIAAILCLILWPALYHFLLYMFGYF